MEYILITNELRVAKEAEESGVGTIMLDLEREGKSTRQANRKSFISNHTIDDLVKLRNALSKSKLMVRVDPISSEGSLFQIETAIELGADAVMLPMARSSEEVNKFLKIINGRVESQVLIETSTSLVRAHEISKLNGLDVIHIGLNDLHIDLHLDFMFEILASGILECAAKEFSRNGVKYGIGGIGRIGGNNAVDPRLIMGELLRLGATQVILSRDFQDSFNCDSETGETKFLYEFEKTRNQFLDLERTPGFIASQVSEELRKSVRNARQLG